MPSQDESAQRLSIFLCHSSGDKPVVRELHRKLSADGFWPWLDEEDILPGQNWDAEIRKAVKSAHVVLVCLSQGSVNKRGYIQREISMVLDAAEEQLEDDIFLIPLRLEDCSVPQRLRRWQWVDYFQDPGKGYSRLLRSLERRENDIRVVVTPQVEQSALSEVTCLIQPSVATSPSGRISTSLTQRLELFGKLASLPEPQFEQMLFGLNPPSGNVPSSQADQSERVKALLDWADSPVGNGLDQVEFVYNQIAVPSADQQPAQPISESTRLTRIVPPNLQFASLFEYEVVTVDSQGKVKDRQKRQVEYRTEDLGDGVTLDMVKIPGGQFQMGSPEGEEGWTEIQGPQHLVTVPEFWMGKCSVTQAQWKAVVGFPKVEQGLNDDLLGFKGGSRPVERVSWYESVEFCKRLSMHTGKEYRLPSEAEWEYACRSRTTTPFHFGETITTDLANYLGEDHRPPWSFMGRKTRSGAYGSGPKGKYRKQTTPVGSFKVANAFGLYDMHGNVYEWCLDYWHDDYKGAPIDGSAWVTGGDSHFRIIRGGSWDHGPRSCRSAYRGRLHPDDRFFQFGFRVCCSAPMTS